MLIQKPSDIPFSEITTKDLYTNRCSFLAGVTAAFLGSRIDVETALPTINP
jgi:hypothetical protein